MVGIEPKRAIETDQRFLRAPQLLQYGAAVCPCSHVLREARNSAIVAHERLLAPIETAQHVPTIVMCVGVVGRELDGPSDQLGRGIKRSALCPENAEKVERIGIIGRLAEYGPILPLSLVEISLLVQQPRRSQQLSRVLNHWHDRRQER